jgi:hypothetical protein
MASYNGWLSRWSKEKYQRWRRSDIRFQLMLDPTEFSPWSVPATFLAMVGGGYNRRHSPQYCMARVFQSRHRLRSAAGSHYPSYSGRMACQSGEEWNGTVLLFDLLPQKETRARLRFSHMDWRAETDYFVACTTTWGELMFRWKAAAEARTPGPLFSATGMAY